MLEPIRGLDAWITREERDEPHLDGCAQLIDPEAECICKEIDAELKAEASERKHEGDR